jgi:hypothetical protein
MVAEVGRRGPDADFIRTLTAVDTTRLPPNALQLLVQLQSAGTDHTPVTAEDVDWIAVGAVLREALGWHDYPVSPPSEN